MEFYFKVPGERPQDHPYAYYPAQSKLNPNPYLTLLPLIRQLLPLLIPELVELIDFLTMSTFHLGLLLPVPRVHVVFSSFVEFLIGQLVFNAKVLGLDVLTGLLADHHLAHDVLDELLEGLQTLWPFDFGGGGCTFLHFVRRIIFI